MAAMNYFNESDVLSATMEFQATGNHLVIHPFTNQLRLLIRGVINCHEIWRFWDNPKELENEGFRTVLECLARFDPTLGKTLFNYLSISVKWQLTNFTRKFNGRSAMEVPLNEAIASENYEDDEFKPERCTDSPYLANSGEVSLCCGNVTCGERSFKICQMLEEALMNRVFNDHDLVLYVMTRLPHSELVVRRVLDCVRQKRKSAA